MKKQILITNIIKFTKNKAALAGMVIILFIAFVAIFAPIISGYDPLAMNENERLLAPSSAHLMGTDEFGRDIFSRIAYGARTSFSIGIISIAIASVIGINIGLISGYFGSVIDSISMRLMDAIIAFPATLFAVVVIAIMGTGSFSAILAISIVSIPAFARLTRANVLAERNKGYVDAEKALGAGSWRIMYIEILPNILSTIFVQITVSIASAILLESALSFLGLGTPPPSPSWGAMLSTGKDFLLYSPTYVIFPGLALTILITGLYLLGDGLRELLDPKKSKGGDT